MARVHFPPALRRLTGQQSVLEIPGRTVGEVIVQLDREYPGFRDRVVAGERLKPGIAVAIGSRVSDLGLLESLETDDEVHFVLSVSGG